MEPRVRAWWLMAMAAIGIAVYLAVGSFREVRSLEELIRKGHAVRATVTSAVIDSAPGRSVDIEYTLNGKSHRSTGPLWARHKDLGRSKTVAIRVDPADPDRWTDLETVSFGQRLFLPGLLLATAALMLALAVLRRMHAVRAWRQGELIPAVVSHVRQSPTAPFSRQLCIACLEGKDRRIHSIFIPMTPTAPQPGERIWLLGFPQHPWRAIVPELYLQG
jgi:hypothetical protein